MGRSQLAWAGALTAAAVTAWAALSRPVEDRLSDLHVYLGAVSSPSLYDFIRGDAPFTYPPFAALLFRPLADLPVATVQFLWTAATIATVAALAFLAAHSLSATASTPNLLTRNAGWPALALTLSAPFSSNIRFGQVSIFLTAAVATDLLALRRTKWSGVLIGAAAAIKLTPLIFIPMLFLAANRRAALRAIATFAACTTAAAIAAPTDTWRFWTEEIFHVSRLGHITSPGNQSLNGMLLRLDLPPDPRTAITITVGGAIAAAALYRASQAARNNSWLTATTITGAASVVLSPVSWTHHQTWLVLAAFLPLTTRVPQPQTTGVSSPPPPAPTTREMPTTTTRRLPAPTTTREMPTTTTRRLPAPTTTRGLPAPTTTQQPPAAPAPNGRIVDATPNGRSTPGTFKSRLSAWSPISGRLPRITPSQAAWPITVLAVMLLPITALGTPLWTNARLFLAIAIAALIPFSSMSRRDPKRRPSSHHPLPPRPSRTRRPNASAPPHHPIPRARHRSPPY